MTKNAPYSLLSRLLLSLCACILLIADSAKPLSNVSQEQTLKRKKGGQFYVAVNGSPDGDGSIDNPWDLQTALYHPDKVSPGNTIWLRDGTYVGKFFSNLKGLPDAPITVRSYPGEWARIDGYKTTPLGKPVNAINTSITLADATNLHNGMTVVIDSEDVQLDGRIGNRFTACNRGWDGTTASIHERGTTVFVGGDALVANGADTIFRDFELFTSDPIRSTTSTNAQAAPNLTGAGVNIASGSLRIKLVNLVIHDARGGVGISSDAIDVEVYGCIIFNNGWVSPNRGNGHGLYIQNKDGRKKVTDTIVFNNFGFGTHAFGEQGFANSITFDGLVSFNNGSPAVFPGNLAKLASNFRETNLFVGTAVNPPQNITAINNCLYHPTGTLVELSNMGFGYIAQGSRNLVVKDNYVAGGHEPLRISGWDSVQVTGNTIYGSGLPQNSGGETVLVTVKGASATDSYTWNNNTYYDETNANNCSSGGDRRTPFFYEGMTGSCGGAGIDFDEWREATGFDQSSKYIVGRPTGVQVFIRPNQYDSSRAHIIVYNWRETPTVKVDVRSILQIGATYEVRNVQDFFGEPVLTGTYDGNPLRLPMSGLSVSTPIGQNFSPQATGPEFNVFVLLQR